METAQGVGSAIVSAIIDRAKVERNKMWHEQQESDLHAVQARHEKDRADAARERWEQCINWLDKNVPNWESTLSEAEMRAVRGGSVPIEVGNIEVPDVSGTVNG